MKKDMPLEGLRWSRDSGSALYDTPQNGRSRTGWGGVNRLFAMIRELPSPLMFAFIGEQAGFGASHLSDSSRVSVAKQPNH